ncbi:glycosyltransferase [Ilumatobacter sp.]|uniref:glycosyltransferase n=1 Tax=Ilumatobacter sp. TaxID=1967498 RepID=UPI003AF65417
MLVSINDLGLGGTQLNAIDFARACRERGIESVLVAFRETLPPGPSLLDVARREGFEIQLVNHGSNIIASSQRLVEIAKREHVDLVHSYGGRWTRLAYWGPHRFGRIPMISMVYDVTVPDEVPRYAPMITGTRILLEEYQDSWPSPVYLVSPPVDTDRDTPAVDVSGFVDDLDLDPDAPRVVIVCRLAESMKALTVDQAIRSLRHLEQQRPQLVIVGDGDAAERLRVLGDEVNSELGRRAVVFAGALDDPRPAYNAADVVIGMGSSAARALAFAKPLVVSGEYGWYRTFTPDTADEHFRYSFWSDDQITEPVIELANILSGLLDDDRQREELGRFGRQFAEQNCGLAAMTDRLADISDETLDRHGDRRRRRWIKGLSNELAPAARRLTRMVRRRGDTPDDEPDDG